MISVRYSNLDPAAGGRSVCGRWLRHTWKSTWNYIVPRANSRSSISKRNNTSRGRDEAQAKLTDFTKETGVVSAQLERDAALQQANEFDSIAHQAQTTMTETEQRVRALQTQLQSMQPRMATVVRTSDNPQLLGQLKSTLLNLELKRTELLTKYKPTYRLVQEVDQQIADAKSAISSEQSKPIREESSDQDPNYQWVRAELTKAQADSAV